MIIYDSKKYHLTPMAKTIVKNFKPFVNTINVFDQYGEWWALHDLSSIPEELLYRIGEINNYFIIEDDPSDTNRTRAEFFNIVNHSKCFFGVSCVFLQTLPELFITAVKNSTPITIVVTDQIYSILKNDYNKEIKQFINNDNAELYVSNDNIKVSHVVSDDCLFFSLCYKNGKFDLQSNLVSNDPSSIKWGKDLFEYYRRRSIKI